MELTGDAQGHRDSAKIEKRMFKFGKVWVSERSLILGGLLQYGIYKSLI